MAVAGCGNKVTILNSDGTVHSTMNLGLWSGIVFLCVFFYLVGRMNDKWLNRLTILIFILIISIPFIVLVSAQ